MAPIVKMDPGVPRTPQAILEKLKQQYQAVSDSKQANENRLVQIKEDVELAQQELEDLKIGATEAADKFRYNLTIIWPIIICSTNIF